MSVERTYTFTQGKDSGGNDIMNAGDIADNIPKLKSKCDSTPKCAGFNTNGWLKHTILPVAQWSTWTADPNKGFYLAGAPIPPPTPPQTPPVPPMPRTETQSMEMTQASDSGSSNSSLILGGGLSSLCVCICICLLLMIGIGVGIYFYTKNK